MYKNLQIMNIIDGPVLITFPHYSAITHTWINQRVVKHRIAFSTYASYLYLMD
jgi:hypothetical protein